MKLSRLFLLLACCAAAPRCRAQTAPLSVNAENATYELEFFSAAGLGATYATANETNWSAGARFGWMLTDRRDSGFLAHRFEYAMDFLPLFANFQQNGVAHGVEFDPVILKWNYTPRHRVQPYLELCFGVAETSIRIPPGDSAFNFTPNMSFGARILRGKYNLSIGLRYLHFSNAYIARYNPGDDSIGIRIAVSRWLK